MARWPDGHTWPFWPYLATYGHLAIWPTRSIKQRIYVINVWCSISVYKFPSLRFRQSGTPNQDFNSAYKQCLQESQFGVQPEWTPNQESCHVPSSGWRKQSFWEGKRQKFELKLFLLGHDLYKRYILQKTGSKTAICVLRTGLSNLQPPMWGSHGQLDDWPTKTQMSIEDHLVGWATSTFQVLIYKDLGRLFGMIADTLSSDFYSIEADKCNFTNIRIINQILTSCSRNGLLKLVCSELVRV